MSLTTEQLLGSPGRPTAHMSPCLQSGAPRPSPRLQSSQVLTHEGRAPPKRSVSDDKRASPEGTSGRLLVMGLGFSTGWPAPPPGKAPRALLGLRN